MIKIFDKKILFSICGIILIFLLIFIFYKDNNNLYLTFDEGYEAGYTEKMLDVLKENNVKATFFITGHYLNTNEELVKRMINEGHIIGNHTPNFLMSGNSKINSSLNIY